MPVGIFVFTDDFFSFLFAVSFQLLRGGRGAGGFWVLPESVLCRLHALEERRVQEVQVYLEHLYLFYVTRPRFL